MFGATFLVPVLTGFPPATTLLFSGVGTIAFLLITGNRLPSYLGSSFSVIAPVTAATASNGMGSALGGIIAVGVLLTGMGQDGARGLKALRERGCLTIAQDQATSAVYGMPKAAAAMKAAVEIRPLDQIASRVIRAFA